MAVSSSTPIAEPGQSAVAWSAILAGGAVAAATTVTLLVMASALGMTLISPWHQANAAATTFAISSAIALIVIQWVSSGLGGYIAGRLRTRWTDVDSDEVFFRDTAHGFVTWCFATLLVVICVTSNATDALRGAGQAASAASSVAPVLKAPAELNPSDYLGDMLFRGQSGATADARAEALRIIANSLAAGSMPNDDKAYLAQLVAARAGVSADEAQKRVDDITARAQAAKAKAQETAEQVRKTAMRSALFLFLSMVVGAFIASAAAAYGGSLRDT